MRDRLASEFCGGSGSANVAAVNAVLAESDVNARTHSGAEREDRVEVNWAAPGE